MSERKYTPGPWRQGGVKEISLIGKCREIVADDGRIGLVYGITDEDCKANAQLIAAAPDMLAALELALQDMARYEIFGPGKKAIQAAIRKAKGE